MKRAIEATTTLPAAHARARTVLLDDPGSVFCDSYSAEQRQARRFVSELSVDVGTGSSLHQTVEIRLGAPLPHEGFAAPLSWRATAHERLFPTFEGTLEASPDRTGTRLTLTGTCHVPLGALGQLGHHIAGRKLAHASLVAFLDKAARRLDAEVQRRMAAHHTPQPATPPATPPDTPPQPQRQPQYAICIHDEVGTENYFG